MTDEKRKTPGLTAALWRDLPGRRAFWASALLLAATLVLLAIFFVRIPASVDFMIARIDSITQIETDLGTRPAYTATTDTGRHFPLVAPNRLTPLLAPGDRICLRVQTDRFTGRVTARHAVEAPECRPASAT
ncbi:hypothetical protein [Roseovarius atlanticus]|uniref:hypothetical protein n=1 Tax=Roseovarius atlanticus TaxID=1641875 RepID=UPI001C94712B|nr:hypothetical protein [Roseovarius atlanticus]MBY5987917.1 hypothetical protein [Roseovarius atlanticus]MBY6123308.1 hypothetical protein [Roseovarius atlanticus]MBY6147803.1 hypothetical protein [Roseovarius atlanticus]